MTASALVCAFSPVGTAALEGLLEAGIPVKALYTYPQGDDEGWYLPPAAVAERAGIAVRTVPDFNADAVFEEIRAEAPDLLLSFYFREMIQARVLEIPRLGAYNLHGSLLPKFRGRAPLNWVLVKGETSTGVTLHEMTPKPDAGAIVGQRAIPIDWDETALSLTLKGAQAGRELVRETLPRLVNGTAERLDQKTLGPSTYFGGRKPADSRLDFAMGAAEAFNQIRAVADPWPNAFLETERGHLHVAWALPSALPCPPGCFRRTPEGVLLGFREGALLVHVLRRDQQRSQRPTDHAAWLDDLGLTEANLPE